MVHSGYEASAVHDTFGSWKGFLATVRATFSTKYEDDEALAMLQRRDEARARVQSAGADRREIVITTETQRRAAFTRP